MTTETPNLELAVGEVIAGKYRVEHVLGQGGMGLVVSALHEQLDQRVAIKLLLPGAAANREIVERFLREARAAVKIHSEHVARVFDVGTHGAVPYMVMEYLQGDDVARTILERGAIAPRDAAGYVLEACDAIAEAHALGIVHRDLKPANLFLAARPAGKPIIKVLDFGISKSPVTEKERAITNATAIMGSPSYMSPEQLVASASVDVRSDIWSLGVVLYEMVTGKLPFNADSMPELVGVILQGSYPPVTTIRSDVSLEMSAVIQRCLQKEREQRFQNVAELARALAPIASPRYEALVERIESLLGMGPPPSSQAPRVAVSSASATAVDNRTLSPTTTGFVGKRQPLWLLAPMVGAVLVAAIVFVVTRHKEPPQAESVVVEVKASNPLPPVTMSIPIPSSTTTASTQTPVPETVIQYRTLPLASHGGSSHAAPPPSASATADTQPALSVAPTAASSPGCKTVSYFDDQGNKHFKLDCH